MIQQRNFELNRMKCAVGWAKQNFTIRVTDGDDLGML